MRRTLPKAVLLGLGVFLSTCVPVASAQQAKPGNSDANTSDLKSQTFEQLFAERNRLIKQFRKQG